MSERLTSAHTSLAETLSSWRNRLKGLAILLAFETLLGSFLRVRGLLRAVTGERAWSPFDILFVVGLLIFPLLVYAVIRVLKAQDELEKLIKQEQQEAAARQVLLDTTTEGIYGIDLDGRCTMVNRAGSGFLGYPPEELIGQQVHHLIHHSYPDGSPYPIERCPIYNVLKDGRPRQGEDDLFWRKDGSSFHVSYAARPIEEPDGNLRGAVVSFTDITQRKRDELALRRSREALEAESELAEARRREAEAANRAKSEFLSRMSHELRTPLNAILGFGQLLEMEELTREQRDGIEHIVKGGRRLLELINEVMDISRIESRTMQLSVEPVLIGEVVREAIALIRPLARERRINLQNEVTEKMRQHHVLADQQRLGQILLNLLSNAVKYNVENGTVSITAVTTDHDRIRIGVTDTGPGIPQDKVSLLFAPFERLGADRTSVEGTGLGLALSKSLTEAMGGQLVVDTTVGEGSTFWIELAASQGPSVEASAVEDAKVHHPNGSTGRVLYIEDNLSNLKLIEHLMCDFPHVELISAMTGTLGLDMAQQHVPDLILLDLHLPDLGGEDVLHRLRQDPRTRTIPVVILSADATKGQIERLKAGGADHYLTKPIDVAEFLGLIERLLGTTAYER